METERLVKDFIVQNYQADAATITAETDLVEAGILDSMGIIQLVTFLEKELNVTFKDEDVTVDNFGSINKITSYLGNL